jgi:hypothetical protein
MHLTVSSSGTTGGRFSIVGGLTGPPAYCASPRIPGRPSGSRAVRSSGTLANVSRLPPQTRPHPQLRLPQRLCVRTAAITLDDAIPILSEPEQQSWRNELFSMIIGPELQAIVTFGLQARIAIEQWTDAPAVMIKKVPHPSSRDAARLITEWRAAVVDLRTVVTPDSDGNNSGPNYDDKFSESDYAPIPRGDLPFGLPNWLGDDSRGRQSRPKRRNTVERDTADLLHTLIWRAPAG